MSGGVIYLSSKTDKEQDLICDLVHEIAHSFEENNIEEIYGDGIIESEFLAKRNSLLQILKNNKYNVSKYDFFNTEYDKSFDEFLYKEVGYDKMNMLTSGLFISSYAATSLREYFANSFEEFFVKDMTRSKKYTPEVYKKINRIFGVLE